MNDNTKEVTKKVVSSKELRIGINIVAFLFFIQPLIIGSIFVLVSTVTTIDDYNNIKGYTKISASLEDKTACEIPKESSTEICNGIYVYTINGKEYKVKGNIKTKALANTINVYYNPDNPSENYILNNMTSFMIVGLFLVMITIFVYISVTKLIKSFLNGAAVAIDAIPTYNKN